MTMGSVGNASKTVANASSANASLLPPQLTVIPSSAALRQIASGSSPGERTSGRRRTPVAPSATQRSSSAGASGWSVSTITTERSRSGYRFTHSAW